MFRFFKEHSYEIVKLFFTQISISVLGLILSFATNSSKTLFLLSSIFAAIFYCCLLYSEGWELGAKDRPRITNGRLKYDAIKGIKFSLFANTVNFVLIFLMLLSFAFISLQLEIFGNIYFISYAIQRTISAMFMGINNFFAPFEIKNGLSYIIPDSIFQPLFYLLSIIPSLLAVGLGYFMGANDRKLFTVKKPD